MRILIVTDAWTPQVNGVVRSLQNTAREARTLGAHIDFLTPGDFRTMPMPTYPEIRLALATPSMVGRRMDEIGADFVHIATEGPLGIMARRICLKRGRVFTTSYHTRFPEYLAARAPVPQALSYAWLRRFHNAGAGVMVSTPTLDAELRGRGFHNIMRWSRGVDASLFRPREHADMDALVRDLPRPIFLSVGRIAVEKNIAAFLALDLPGSKVVVGEGPARAELEARYPAVHFVGLKQGEELARIYAAADVFVFPSLTDTFGIVLLEALASGLPVAAFPVTGPMDVIGEAPADAPVGVLDNDLRRAALAAVDIDRGTARAYAQRYSWRACTEQFLSNIETAQARSQPPRQAAG
ncbi:glycosyltransferase family 4 protein [Ancylobacter amanitiformis]|uniref:Glycosyltransferase involved in cell wall biosynthesis n=1 Tax=Ancylobacter amanitiformis TaxID=217069 RepID=A0ABU0LLD0_9HYPH|nr:glycosyltransferase family 1 protein [Ancylobacter amanitiformis]MDQ0509428.1 glycosyltransferase involved in cell wall biosynthesis [Ancylobacter amanitiformis]